MSDSASAPMSEAANSTLNIETGGKVNEATRGAHCSHMRVAKIMIPGVETGWCCDSCGAQFEPVASRSAAASPPPAPQTRDAAQRAFLEAGQRFWEAERENGTHGGLNWLQGSMGELAVFTRGEYRDHLLRNVEPMGRVEMLRPANEDDIHDVVTGTGDPARFPPSPPAAGRRYMPENLAAILGEYRLGPGPLTHDVIATICAIESLFAAAPRSAAGEDTARLDWLEESLRGLRYPHLNCDTLTTFRVDVSSAMTAATQDEYRPQTSYRGKSLRAALDAARTGNQKKCHQ